MIEKWKDVPGYDGKYQADTEGNIRRVYKLLSGKLEAPVPCSLFYPKLAA